MTKISSSRRITLGLLALASIASVTGIAEARAYSTCSRASYVNTRGHCVHRPMKAVRAPAGAAAQCRDGSYSFSESHRGTCSWHGGVSRWLN